MKVLIIEDETPAANKLIKMIKHVNSEIDILDKLDSVETAVSYFKKDPEVDLIFMDIQLADGLSFDIFSQVEVGAPVIFTTAFDQYTLKAFKVNSVDYLLKPIDESELESAINKYRTLHKKKAAGLSDKMLDLATLFQQNKFKERLLIKKGQQLGYLRMEDLACCFADGKFCYAIDKQSHKYLLEINLARLEDILSPSSFYRINRHLIVNIDYIFKVQTWVGGRLKVEMSIKTEIDTMVSRERVNGFKDWLGQ